MQRPRRFHVVMGQEIDKILLVRLPQSKAIEQPLRPQLCESVNIATLGKREQMSLQFRTFHRPPGAEAGFVVRERLVVVVWVKNTGNRRCAEPGYGWERCLMSAGNSVCTVVQTTCRSMSK